MPPRSPARTRAALICLTLGLGLALGLLAWLMPHEGRVLGPAFQSVIRFLVARMFGLSVFFLPAALFTTGFFLLKRSPSDSATRLPRLLGSGGLALFSLNVILCNTGLSHGAWAGFFPLFTHALVLQALGHQGHMTLATLLVEVLVTGLAALWFAAEVTGHPPHEIIRAVWKSSRSAGGVAQQGMEKFGAGLTRGLVATGVLTPVREEDRTRLNAHGPQPVWRKVALANPAGAGAPEQTPHESVMGEPQAHGELQENDSDLTFPHPEGAEAFTPDQTQEILGSGGSPLSPAPFADTATDIAAGEGRFGGMAPAAAGDFIPADNGGDTPPEAPAEMELDLSAMTFGPRPESAEPLIPEEKTATPNKGKVPRLPLVLNDPRSPSVSARADSQVLEYSPVSATRKDEVFLRDTSRKLEETVRSFGIESKVVGYSTGPVITSFELTIEPGVKVSRIRSLQDDIALALATPSVRIVAPIPGKSVIGIELPNKIRQMVRLRDVVDTAVFRENRMDLPVALGKDIQGQSVVADLASMPHLLVAGATGAGKSVCVNGILCSLLLRLSPSEIRLLLVDPKMVELNVYNDIPHLLAPVITDSKKAALSLRWIIAEMEARYALLEKHGVRHIKGYNDLVRKCLAERRPLEGGLGTLPFIVVVIDEFADLMMVARKEVEESVTRLAAMSRAVGIHLILATQRPSVDVITGIIKANFPSRIAFQVSSQVDARTILDDGGAEKLLGKGDMLFVQRSGAPERLQGAFLSDGEVARIVETLRSKGAPDYMEPILPPEPEAEAEEGDDRPKGQKDPMWDQALDLAFQEKKISGSYLQRRLGLGYNRAARIIEEMERMGYISSGQGSKPREVLVSNRF